MPFFLRPKGKDPMLWSNHLPVQLDIVKRSKGKHPELLWLTRVFTDYTIKKRAEQATEANQSTIYAVFR